MGVPVPQVVAKINEKTSEFKGMNVPVTVIVDAATKTFEVAVGRPPTSAFIKKELGLETAAKGAPEKGQEVVGDLSLDQVVKVAREKSSDMFVKDLKGAAKQVIAECGSMGVTIEGHKSKEALKALDSGELKLPL
jgi:large subunit ribosomal protein L11